MDRFQRDGFAAWLHIVALIGLNLFLASYRFEKPLLEVVMQRTEGNQSKAAAWLGINRNTLRRKLLEHKLIK